AGFDRGFVSVGWKWTRGQNSQVLSTMIADPSTHKIVLVRRNRIKTFVSERIAQQTQQWEAYDANRLVTPPKVHIRLGELEQHIQQNEDFYHQLESALTRHGQHYLRLAYESLCDRATHRQLLEFLQVGDPKTPLAATSVKQNTTDLRQAIDNYDELLDQLATSSLSAELIDLHN
ncbi:MAG: hypothetical protein KDB23_20960, partial [Planctomycetales bacterium]|nr:hypothetical protein [Planctomycetales bacterium]